MHTTPEAKLDGVISTDDPAWNDLVDVAYKAGSAVAPYPANLAVTCNAHRIARIVSARDHRTLTRPGSLGGGER